MQTIHATLRSLSPYSQSRPHCEPKLAKELPDSHEARTWHHRLHVKDGQVVMPSNSIRNALAEAAKYLSIQIPGKGKATYTKHFESGVLVTQDAPLFTHSGSPIIPPSELGLRRVLCKSPQSPIEDEEAVSYLPPVNEAFGDWVYVPSDGIRGSGKRVWKCYPVMSEWQASFEFLIVDEMITKDVFMKVLKEAGVLIGLGRFRVRNCGTYGRFEILE
jgi:hypothetical protein